MAHGEFRCEQPQMAAFEPAKRGLAQLPSLAEFSEDRHSVIFTDGSKTGIGASLVQIVDGVIQFWSCSASKAS